MTLEQAFFIQALAAYIQGKSDIRVPGGWEGLDWSQLLRYAKTQNLAGIFFMCSAEINCPKSHPCNPR